MIIKRLGAVVLAGVLILGAVLIRDRVIDDNGGPADSPRADREIVCVSDLSAACAALAEALEIDIRIEDAGDTLDALAALEDPSEAPIWITFDPFPGMVDNLRIIDRRSELVDEQIAIASSPMMLVIPLDRAPTLVAVCGEPIGWTCVGEYAGEEWTTIDGDPGLREIKPAFAPVDTAIGLLGVADAIAGFFGGAPIDVNNTDFLQWARRLGTNAVPQGALTGGTPIATIETRPSALDIAVGAKAEVTDAGGSRFALEYAEPMIRADVMVSIPQGTSLPSGLTEELEKVLIATGWEAASAEANPLPSPPEMLAIRATWQDFS